MSAILKRSNRGGIPCMKSSSAVVSDTTLTVTFPTYTNFPKNFSGEMILNIEQSFTSTGVTSVILVIQGTSIQLKTNASSAATSTEIPAPGIYEVFVDNSTQTIQLI